MKPSNLIIFRSTFYFISLIALSFFSLSGCLLVDDQTELPQSWQSTFNTQPNINDALESNKKHQVLIAVIDSGVDYNHPLLKESIHYKIDGDGKVIGAGYDLLGEDPWPLPYLAYKKLLFNNLYFQNEKVLSEELRNKILLRNPKLAPYFDQYRDLEAEQSNSVYHGTHVAGLASYDDDRIGILPYRVFPMTKPNNLLQYKETIDYSGDRELKSWANRLALKRIIRAVEKAAEDGADIISMSLASSSSKTNEDIEVNFISSNSSPEAKNPESPDFSDDDFNEFYDQFYKLTVKYSSVVFVAASGNEKGFFGFRRQFPCGVNSPNILCVSSLSDRNIISSFSNVPKLKSVNPLLFASGEDLLSTVPTRSCQAEPLEMLFAFYNPFKQIKYLYSDQNIDFHKKKVNVCLKQIAMGYSTGTSMSTPAVARLMAQHKIETKLNGSQLIQSFLNKNTKSFVTGNLVSLYVEIPEPIWTQYSKKDFVFKFKGIAQ